MSDEKKEPKPLQDAQLQKLFDALIALDAEYWKLRGAHITNITA